MLVKVGGTLRSHISSGNAVRTFARPVLRNDRDCRIDADPKMKTPWRTEFETGRERDLIVQKIIREVLAKDNHG